MTEKQYDVILADPPWRYNFSQSAARKIENHYPTMSVEDICGLDCRAADDAILYLWATAPKIEEALAVMKAWGFTYKTQMVWVKDKIGMGYYCRNQHEIIMIGTKGKFKPPSPSTRPSSVLRAPRKKHSSKPVEMYGLIETMYPNMRYYEMFCRDRKQGWDVFGNETPPHVQQTIHDFDDCLNKGLQGEDMFSKRFGELFDRQLSHIHFCDDSKTQKNGIDFVAWIKSIKYEVKTRSYGTHKYRDILFETMSVIEDNKRGWTHTTKSECVVYLWMNQARDMFIDGYVINMDEMRAWLESNDITRYKRVVATSKRQCRTWHTENRAIPITSLPPNVITKLDIR